jgi:hypothetical protein
MSADGLVSLRWFWPSSAYCFGEEPGGGIYGCGGPFRRLPVCSTGRCAFRSYPCCVALASAAMVAARNARLQFSTQALIFSAPHALPRQVLASWTAGVLLAVITGGGLGVHPMFARSRGGLFAWAVHTVYSSPRALCSESAPKPQSIRGDLFRLVVHRAAASRD